ncbi:MAG: phage tail protein [Clostridia bacterium]|nr:phage tail protein [Clostridia bacterium]
MFLLNGHSLTPVRGVPAEALSLTLKERDSTASITPVDMDGIQIGSWLQDDTEPGKGIVWRVKSIRTVYATQTPTVELEHAIRTLNDRILFGETTAGDISGGATCTAKQAVQYILRQQSDWVLGQFDYNVSNPYKFDSDTLLDALETVSNSLDECWWSYDFSSYPFKLNMTRKPAGVACELRSGRNLTALTKTIDTSGMYTRMYPIGKDDLHISGGGYVEKNANLYGVVAKVDTDSSLETEAELQAWANERLAKHAEPLVTIDVEGLELADATGEPLDKLTLGRLCRIPLPEFGANIEERITELSYQDKLHQPEVVKITLANSQEDVTRIIADNMKKSGHGGRASGRQSKEDHAWFEDTDDHVSMMAIGIIGRNAEGEPDWVRMSEITANEDGIYLQVKNVQGEVEISRARIDINENAITQEVRRANEAEGTLRGSITVQADRITQEVTRANEAEGVLAGRIQVEAGKISQIVSAVGANGQVTAASIVLAVNNSGSTVNISADKIRLSGNTTIGNVMSINNNGLIINRATRVSGNVMCDSLTLRNGGSEGTISANDVEGLIKSASVSGNVLTLTPIRGDPINFSKATSLTGSWSGRYFTVIAKQNNVEVNRKSGIVYDGLVPTGSVSVSGKNVSRDFIVYSDDGEGDADTQIMTKTVTIDASDVYDNGKNSTTVSSVSRSVQTTDPGSDYTALTQATISADRWLKIDIALSSGVHPGKYKMKLVHG